MMHLQAKCQTLSFNFGELRFDSSYSATPPPPLPRSLHYYPLLFCLLSSLNPSYFAILIPSNFCCFDLIKSLDLGSRGLSFALQDI